MGVGLRPMLSFIAQGLDADMEALESHPSSDSSPWAPMFLS